MYIGQISLFVMVFFVFPLTVLLISKKQINDALLIVLSFPVLAGPLGLFIGKAYAGGIYGVAAFLHFSFFMLYQRRLSTFSFILGAIYCSGFALTSGVLLGDALGYRIRDFSDDFSGALCALPFTALIFITLSLTALRKK